MAMPRTGDDLIDFHTHILPKMDDGSKSVDESLRMLTALNSQGVSVAVISPHYYRSRETIPEFLVHRENSQAELNSVIGDTNLPDILVGAETAFFMDMSREPDIHKLCIAGTNKLLVEMPFNSWTTPIINEIYQLIATQGIIPIIAHAERYIDYNSNLETLESLISFGAVVQSNAEFFLTRKTRRRAFTMLNRGYIHIFGSDCHNMRNRAPNMGELYLALRKKISSSELDALQVYGKELLSEHPRKITVQL
jgi:protein-tyrosine phosphatase